MKKLLLLILLVITLSGCTKIDSNNTNYDELVNNIINNKNIITNKASSGYKYYLPKGCKLVFDREFNQEIKYLDNRLYLYVDVVSYYHDNNLNYEIETNNYYYFNKIGQGSKAGYILIEKMNDDNYYVKIIYNYAKIEFYTNHIDLSKSIVISSIILKNIDYNDNLIEKMLDDTSLSREIVYEIDKPDGSSSKFSQYLEEYVQEEKQEELPDDE